MPYRMPWYFELEENISRNMLYGFRCLVFFESSRGKNDTLTHAHLLRASENSGRCAARCVAQRDCKIESVFSPFSNTHMTFAISNGQLYYIPKYFK